MIVYGRVYCACCSCDMGQVWGQYYRSFTFPSAQVFHCPDCSE